MSWSHTSSNRNKAEAAQHLAADPYLPEGIKAYIASGVQAYKEDVPVQINAHGHLHNGQDYDVTSATISVRRMTPEEIERNWPGDKPSDT